MLWMLIRALPAQVDRHKTSASKHIRSTRAANIYCNMRSNTLFFLLILGGVCLALAQVSYDDCCLKYVKNLNKGAQRHAVAYRRQEPDGGCNIPAVIFTMKRGRQFCTDPREKWVTELIKKIEKRNPRNGKHIRKHQPQQKYKL